MTDNEALGHTTLAALIWLNPVMMGLSIIALGGAISWVESVKQERLQQAKWAERVAEKKRLEALKPKEMT